MATRQIDEPSKRSRDPKIDNQPVNFSAPEAHGRTYNVRLTYRRHTSSIGMAAVWLGLQSAAAQPRGGCSVACVVPELPQTESSRSDHAQ